MTYAEDTIEFVLSHVAAIKQAVADKRLDNGSGGHTGGNGTGHMRVSDPTAIQAIRAISDLPKIEIPYGPIVAGERETWELRRPERWIKLAETIREHYMDNKRIKDFYRYRYGNNYLNDNWQSACKELKISRAAYYAMRADVIHMAELYAVQYGVLAPCWHGVKLT